ncbi:MAG: hypothetical protein HC769_36855 [Cyanobacteria bacterium CRU_2_1]|nr:hypothetical protein [Cyanobacteria bacterium CRU_2_1]
MSDRRKVWDNLVTQKRADQLGDMVELWKHNQEAIEAFGRFILQIFGGNLPQLPGS